MKHSPRTTALLLICYFILPACDSHRSRQLSDNRNLSIPPIEYGPFPVASSNFSLITPTSDIEILFDAASKGRDLYIDKLLTRPEDSFTYTLQVPDQEALYGRTANKSIPYAGLIFYPTSDVNKNIDYHLPNGQLLPLMDSPNQPPTIPTNNKHPLLVLSHGLGAAPTDYFELETAKFFASHGYIVLAPFHGDERFPTMIDSAENGIQQFTLRPLAIQQAIDKLLMRSQFSQYINHEQIGGLGVSFGGATVFALTGGRFSGWNDNALTKTAQDPRIKSAVGLSPFFGYQPTTPISGPSLPMFGADGQGGKHLKQPYMAISGTEDTIATWEASYNVMSHAAQNNNAYLIGLDGAEHFFNEDQFKKSLSWALTFLNAHVLLKAEAIKTLAKLNSIKGPAVDFVAIEPNTEKSPPGQASQ